MYKFHSLGPFLFVFSSGQEYYQIDLKELIIFYNKAITDKPDYHYTITIDGIKRKIFQITDLPTIEPDPQNPANPQPTIQYNESTTDKLEFYRGCAFVGLWATDIFLPIKLLVN